MQKYWFKAKSAATYESKSEIQRLVDNVMVLTIVSYFPSINLLHALVMYIYHALCTVISAD